MKQQKQKINNWFARVAQSVDDKLSEWINPLSPSVKRKGLIVMGLSTSMVCAMLVIKSLHNNGISAALEIDAITTSIDIAPLDTVPVYQTDQDIIRQYNRMIQFKELVDKFESTSNAEAIDSLMNAHPGLRDSLYEFVRRYYPH